MIIEISIENFKSIRERVVLSLESTASKKIMKNVMDFSGDKLLKSIAIYGANATGKTNIISAILFVWNMVVNSHKNNVGDKINRIPFKLDSHSDRKPSKFELKFIHEGIKYRYGFSCTNEKFIDEYLFYSPKGKESLVFKRQNTDKFTFTKDTAKQKTLSKQTLDNTLYLSRATQLRYERTMRPYNFFKDNIVVNPGPIQLAPGDKNIGKRILEDEKLKERLVNLIKKADFGIEGIRATKSEKKGKSLTFELKKNGTFTAMESEEDIYNIKISHKKRIGEGKELSVDFDIVEESAGTIRALVLWGAIYDVLEKGKTIIIDEIETSMHPEIVKLLIRFFNNEKNRNAQLIFTTHNTSLLDNQLFRKDQIYLTSKRPNENTELHSLSEFSIRQENDFERAYLDGRFGGIPIIDETLLDNYDQKTRKKTHKHNLAVL